MKYKLKSFWYVAVDVFKFVAVLSLVVSGGIWGIGLVAKISCERKTVAFEEHRFSLAGGCMVKYDGKFYPIKNIRIIKN
jgi:hypothetical protein